MDWNLLIIFVVLNVVNVIIQTVKSIATIKCGKTVAAIVNAVAYGLYTIVLVYTVCELNLWLKAGVVAVANLIGVYVVKAIEEKSRKEKLWKVETTVNRDYAEEVHTLLENAKIPHSFVHAGPHTIFNCYCETCKQSNAIKEILTNYNAKYFVSESKVL